MRYGYYPGCSLSGLARPYDISTKAIAAPLGIELEEVEDWNCCGATEYFAVNRMAAYSLVGRNLANAAAQDGFTDLVAPCSACTDKNEEPNNAAGSFSIHRSYSF